MKTIWFRARTRKSAARSWSVSAICTLGGTSAKAIWSSLTSASDLTPMPGCRFKRMAMLAYSRGAYADRSSNLRKIAVGVFAPVHSPDALRSMTPKAEGIFPVPFYPSSIGVPPSLRSSD